MERRPFGKTGLEVSVIGFGAAPIGLLKTEQDRVEQILNFLLDEGVNLIDTAASYQGSEEAIGRAVSSRRDEYVLVSKCGRHDDDLSGTDWSADLITRTIDRSLKRLQTDHLDVMLLHSCDLDVLKQGEAVEALVKAREAGKIRFAGYSGDNEAAEYAAGLTDIAVVETSVSICDQANIDFVLPAAIRHEIGVIAKRPIANAAWKELSQQPGFYQEYAQTYTQRLARMKVTPADLGFDGDPDSVWPEIALRFTLSQPGVHTAIIGTTDPGHARKNLAAAAQGPLPEGAIDHLRQAFHIAQQDAGETWQGET